MKQRSSNNWKTKSGTWDALKTEFIDFDSNYPFLNCKSVEFENIVNCNDNKKIVANSLISMFLDDYILERFWNRPLNYLERFANCTVMSPDFSLLVGMPEPLQMFQVYRNRLVGYIWQNRGLNVVPCISWSDSKSFEYCFNGVVENSIVAVSNVGCRNTEHKKFFDSGFDAMIEKLNPSKILFMCNKKFRSDYKQENIIFLDTFFDKKRKIWEAEADKV